MVRPCQTSTSATVASNAGAAAIHVQLQRRTSKTPGPIGSIAGISFTDIDCAHAEIGSVVEGAGAVVGGRLNAAGCAVLRSGTVVVPPSPTGRHPSCRRYDQLPPSDSGPGADAVTMVDSVFTDAGGSGRPAG